jgi:hypothetical protein
MANILIVNENRLPNRTRSLNPFNPEMTLPT